MLTMPLSMVICNVGSNVQITAACSTGLQKAVCIRAKYGQKIPDQATYWFVLCDNIS